MSISKKKSYALKDRAKELGYDLKLTHCQELVAQVEGFNNRHALLVNDKKTSTEDTILKEKIDFFISENKLEENKEIVKYLQSNEKLIELKKRINKTVNDLLCESLKKVRCFEFKDSYEETECVVAYNLKQASDYLEEMFEVDVSAHYTVRELSDEDLKLLKMRDSDKARAKIVSAYKIMHDEIDSGESLPFHLYSSDF